MALTEKQKRFAEYYIQCGNAAEAAHKAGYSKKTANVIGAENLSKPNIREYVDQKLEEMSSDRIADATEVLEYLTSVMRREHQENIVVTLNREKSIYVPDENGTMRKQTIKEEEVQVIQIPSKLSDANKAAELLGKRYRLFTDKIDIDATDTITFVEDLSVDE